MEETRRYENGAIVPLLSAILVDEEEHDDIPKESSDFNGSRVIYTQISLFFSLKSPPKINTPLILILTCSSSLSLTSPPTLSPESRPGFTIVDSKLSRHSQVHIATEF